MRRRDLVAGGLLLCLPLQARAGGSDPGLAALEARRGGRLGVHVLDLADGRTLSHRADERFKLFSTFKALLAAMVLAEVAAGRQSLAARVPFGRADLMAASPVTSAHVDEGFLSVETLCEAIMHRSDNAAANLLMRRLGGPAALTAYLRCLGDRTTRIDSYEGEVAGRPAAFDTTTPRAVAATMRDLLFGTGLPAASRRTLRGWMEGNVVGRARLRAAFPADWRGGDRTGTGDGWCNDCAFAERPGRAPLVIAAYYEAPGLELDAQEEALREVSARIVAWQRA